MGRMMGQKMNQTAGMLNSWAGEEGRSSALKLDLLASMKSGEASRMVETIGGDSINVITAQLRIIR